MLSSLHTFATNTPSTFSSPAVFYFCQRMKRCSINFLLLASMCGISAHILMDLASILIQNQRRNLISFSRRFEKNNNNNNGNDDSETDEEEEIEDEKNKGRESTTADLILSQYAQYLATWKKPWILRVVDECAQRHRNQNDFGKNVFDELLLNFAYFSSNSNTNTALSSSTSASKQQEQDNDKAYLAFVSSNTNFYKNPSTRTKLVFSTVAKYFASRFVARLLWGLMLFGIEKAFTRIILFSSSSSSSTNDESSSNPYFPFSKNFAEGVLQISSINNDSNDQRSDYLFSALLEFTLHVDFYFYGISSKRGKLLHIPSAFLLQCFNVAGAPCSNIGNINAVSLTRELLGKSSTTNSASFIDVMLYHVVCIMLNEDVFTLATRLVGVFMESYESVVKNSWSIWPNNTNNNKISPQQQQQQQKEQESKSLHVFDEEGNVLASISPNSNNENNLRSIITSPSSSSSSRARFRTFLGGVTKTFLQVLKKDIPNRIRQMALTAIGTYVLRRVIGEKRISWYTCSVISYYLVY